MDKERSVTCIFCGQFLGLASSPESVAALFDQHDEDLASSEPS